MYGQVCECVCVWCEPEHSVACKQLCFCFVSFAARRGRREFFSLDVRLCVCVFVGYHSWITMCVALLPPPYAWTIYIEKKSNTAYTHPLKTRRSPSVVHNNNKY